MRKLILLSFLLLSPRLYGQGYNYQNFSQFTNGHTLVPCTSGGDCTLLSNGWFGSGTGGVQIQNSVGALTITNSWACPDGPPPNHSGNILDYGTTLGKTAGHQEVDLKWPSSGASTVSQGAFWFCSTLPASYVMVSGTADVWTLITGASGLSNFLSNGTKQWFQFEGFNSDGHGVGPNEIDYTPNTGVLIVWQYVANGSCLDHVAFTDCSRIAIYDRNRVKLGEIDDSSHGAGNTGAFQTFGDLTQESGFPNGFHFQFSDIWTCLVGCNLSEFPTFQNLKQPWQGIITPGRAIDWSQAGIPASNTGTLPDAAWTQCGSTVAAGTSAASVQTLLNACSANTYLLLGPGAFTWTTSITPTSNRVIKGSGANSTFITMTGSSGCAGQISATFCLDSSDHSFTTGPPATVYDVTSGYTQGSTALTLSSVTGINIGTLLFLDQDNTSYTGAPATGGPSADNGNLYICGDRYAATPSGCASGGPDTAGSRTHRDQLETHTVTAVNGSVVTITPPISMPNYSSGLSPQVWVVQPLANVGVENLSIDLSNGSAPAGCIETLNATSYWINGVRCVNNKFAAFNLYQAVNGIVQSNYVFSSTGTLPSNYGIRLSASAYNVVQNNIVQQIQGGSIFEDGASTGDVIAYNYIIRAISSGGIDNPLINHAGDYLGLKEGNAVSQVSCDNVHATCDFDTRFRNFLFGWESNPPSPITSFTNPIADWAFSRYHATIAGVEGTPGYHTTYSTTSNSSSIYNMGTGNGAIPPPTVPNDSLTQPTSLFWANYDTVTVATRFCGNSLDTNWSAAGNCNSTSETPTAAAVYPNGVPFVGDTAVGQPTLPASFYLSARPSWWNVSIPFPAIGPDVSSGNMGQCSGAINVVGQFNGVPALTNAQCGNHGITASTWGGHVNAIPAMACALTLGMPPDGSGSAIAFDANTCYSNTTPGTGGHIILGVTVKLGTQVSQ